MPSKRITHKTKRKTRSKRNYKGGGNQPVKKQKVVEFKVPLFLQEIDDVLDLGQGEGYYFDIGKGIYYGTYIGNRRFTNTYNMMPLPDRNGKPTYDEPYNGVVEAKNKIYKLALHPRGGLPSELRKKIDNMTGSKPEQAAQAAQPSQAAQVQQINPFGQQPSYSPSGSPQSSQQATPS